MRQRLTLRQRRELIGRMSKVFRHNVNGLSAELQGILSDDLVTAFESRINVLIRARGITGEQCRVIGKKT